jgi:hypothetical protein
MKRTHTTTDETATPAAATTAAASPAQPPPASTPGAVTALGSGVVPIAPPPAGANIPVSPKGWQAPLGADYRGTQPKNAELATIAGAIADLQRFTTYEQVLGTSVPSRADVIQLFTVANEWSTMRGATASWDIYAAAQEGLAWAAIRAVMETLRPAFDLASSANKSLATQLPSLAGLLDAQKVIARRSAATRAANKGEKAEGRPETHGKVGRSRARAAAKAALAAQQAASASAGAAGGAPGPAQAAEAPATPPAASTPGTTNGTAH